MPSTRSGLIYSNSPSVAPTVASSVAPTVASSVASTNIISESPVRKSPRLTSEERRYQGQIHRGSLRENRPAFFEPRPVRANRTTFTEELLRELCEEEDNDSTSDYEIEDEEVQQYFRESFLPITLPRYEVEIDFDGASTAWRSNKRRVGESWTYTRPSIKKHAASLVSSHVASHVASSIASRVKGNRRHNIESKI